MHSKVCLQAPPSSEREPRRRGPAAAPVRQQARAHVHVTPPVCAVNSVTPSRPARAPKIRSGAPSAGSALRAEAQRPARAAGAGGTQQRRTERARSTSHSSFPAGAPVDSGARPQRVRKNVGWMAAHRALRTGPRPRPRTRGAGRRPGARTRRPAAAPAARARPRARALRRRRRPRPAPRARAGPPQAACPPRAPRLLRGRRGLV